MTRGRPPRRSKKKKKSATRPAPRPRRAPEEDPAPGEDPTLRFTRVLELPEPDALARGARSAAPLAPPGTKSRSRTPAPLPPDRAPLALVRAVRDGLVALGADEAPSRFGGQGVAFHRGRRELAHFHPGLELDLRLPRAIQRELRGDPRVVPRRSASDWVALRFETRADVAWLLDLARHAFEWAGE